MIKHQMLTLLILATIIQGIYNCNCLIGCSHKSGYYATCDECQWYEICPNDNCKNCNQVKCDNGCAECIGSGKCSVCNSGYDLSDGYCTNGQPNPASQTSSNVTIKKSTSSSTKNNVKTECETTNTQYNNYTLIETQCNTENICESIGPGCFSLDQEVYVQNQQNDLDLGIPIKVTKIKLKDLKIGDNIMTRDQNGSLKLDKILGLLHYSQNKSVLFLNFMLQDVENKNILQKLVLSAEHMVSYNSSFVQAQMLKIGDKLQNYYLEEESGAIQKQTFKIIDITQELQQGYIAPLTFSGTIIVNGVFSSCYVQYSNIGHQLADRALYPLKMYLQFFEMKYRGMSINKFAFSSDEDKELDEFQPVYTKVLQKIHYFAF